VGIARFARPEESLTREYERFLSRNLRRQTVPKSQEATQAIRLDKDDVDFVGALLRDAKLIEETRTALAGIDLEDGPLAEVLLEGASR